MRLTPSGPRSLPTVAGFAAPASRCMVTTLVTLFFAMRATLKSPVTGDSNGIFHRAAGEADRPVGQDDPVLLRRGGAARPGPHALRLPPLHRRAPRPPGADPHAAGDRRRSGHHPLAGPPQAQGRARP